VAFTAYEGDIMKEGTTI